jgi:hypothetical protein
MTSAFDVDDDFPAAIADQELVLFDLFDDGSSNDHDGIVGVVENLVDRR